MSVDARNSRPRRRPNNNSRNNSSRTGGRPGGTNRRHNNKGNVINGKTKKQAEQALAKFLDKAKNARSSGDPYEQEYYLQHADHYQRIIDSFEENNQSAQSSSHASRQKPQESVDDDAGNRFNDDDNQEDSEEDNNPPALTANGLPENVLPVFDVPSKDTE